MSAKFSARSGISPVTLVAFIVVFLVAIVVAFVMYTRQVQVSQALEAAKAQSETINTEVNNLVLAKQGPAGYLAMANPTADNVREYFKNLPMRGLTVEPHDFPSISRALDTWILRLGLANSDLKTRAAAAKVQADSEETARDASRDEYSRRVQDKNAEARKLDDFLKTETAKKEDLVKRYNDEKKSFADKYVNARDVFENKKSDFVRQVGTLKGRNAVVMRDLRTPRPEASLRPPVGHVIREEWKTHQAVIDVGQHEQVFPGLVFEVYYFDQDGARQLKGRLEVMSVFATTSVCNVVETSRARPVVAGDPVQTPFLPVRPGQKFVIAGFLPSDAAYDEEKLKTIIRLNGGIIQDSVNLKTDTLILGEVSAHGLMEMDKKSAAEAPDKSRRGTEQAQIARELSVDTVNYQDFIQGLLR